ncbi:MAG: OmpA family protein [Saprospiraceae bacterium]|nr:OmpA family protein [Saprospiraceae bacterium]MDW8229929.1 OmpA family protein [Saprospiraceae bacterium]
MKPIALVFILSFVLSSITLFAQEDHPLVSRFEGAIWVCSYTNNYTSYLIATEPGTSDGIPNALTPEGKLSAYIYLGPKGRSILEIFRNYEQQLRKGGFDVLFSCVGDKCMAKGYANFFVLTFGSYGNANKIEQRTNGNCPKYNSYVYSGSHYLSARKNTAKGAAYVVLALAEVNEQVYIFLDILETAAMETDKVKVDAAYMAKSMSESGKVLLYDILFETGKAVILPTSESVLNEIAAFIKTRPGRTFYVTGHTDDTGNLAANMTLSQQRADAVVTALSSRGISASQLIARGVGPLAPVGNNRTDEGRRLNRRVELIEKL